MGVRAHRWLIAAVLPFISGGCNGILGIDEPTVMSSDAAITYDAGPSFPDAPRVDAHLRDAAVGIPDAKVDAPISMPDASSDARPADAASRDAASSVDAAFDAP